VKLQEKIFTTDAHRFLQMVFYYRHSEPELAQVKNLINDWYFSLRLRAFTGHFLPQ
jgi:hypothetical protein